MPIQIKYLVLYRFWFIKKRREIRLTDPLATLHVGEGANSWPGEWITGEYKLITMKKLIKNILQNFDDALTRTIFVCNAFTRGMCMCCCCCC